MSGGTSSDPKIGQLFRHTGSGVLYRVEHVTDRQVTYSVIPERVSVYRETWVLFARGQLSAEWKMPPGVKPTIPLRIRVGVTADGTWISFGCNSPSTVSMDTQQMTARAMLEDHGPIVAWHWITAEIPMPETEQGDVAGEVERSCKGMSSDQKVQP